jgi:glycogen synthase
VLLARMVASGLARRGHEVAAWTSTAASADAYWDRRGRQADTGVTLEDGVNVERLGLRYLPWHWRAARLVTMLSPGAGPWLSPPSPWVPELIRRARRPRAWPNIIHATCFPLDAFPWAGFAIARKLGVPFVLTPLMHMGAESRDALAFFRRYYQRPWQLRMLREADAVLALTPSEARCIEECTDGAARVRVVAPGLDVEGLPTGVAERFRERFGLRRRFVLHTASLSRAKGTIDLIEAVRSLHASGRSDAPDLVLLGAPDREVRAYLEGHGPGGWCHVLGYVDEQAKHDALAACTAFCLPSAADAFGLAFLEAWAYAKPVVGARAGGIPDLLRDGDLGLLVGYGAPADLAQALAALLGDPARCAQLGEAGQRALMAQYTSEALLDGVEAVHASLLAHP